MHCPGKLHLAADALSRYPANDKCIDSPISSVVLQEVSKQDIELSYESEMNISIISAVRSINDLGNKSEVFSAINTDMIENSDKSDPSYMNLLKWTEAGFPSSKHKCDPDIKCYWEKRYSLCTFGNIVMMDNRLIIPQTLRKTILYALHSAHQGCDGMLARANNSVYWPQIRQAILNFRASCKSCHVNGPSLPKEPYMPSQPAQYPFQKVCADYCEYNQRPFLIITDRFSGWIHIYGVSRNATSRSFYKTL